MDLMDYRRKIIANSPHLMSASGAVATFSDGAYLPLENLVVDIEPVQSGTGDPSPTNVRPISGWDAVNVVDTGKNLWHPVSNYPATGNGITYSLNADGSIHVQGTASAQSNNYPIASNGLSVDAGTYTISIHSTDSNIHFICGGGGGTAGLAYTDMTNNASKTFTTSGGTTGHNIIRVNSGATVNGDIYIQLEKGSTATPWESYNRHSVTINLGRTVYGGTLNPLTGVLTVDRQFFELDGNSNVTKGSSGTTQPAEAFPYWATIYIPCNNATTNYSAWRFSHGKCQSAAYSGIFRTFKANNTTIQTTVGTDALLSTTADAKTWLQAQKDNGTPLQIVAELTTPLTYQLSPQTFRSLVGNNNIFADTGNVALEYWAHP